MAIITTAEYKAYSGIQESSYDTLISTLADVATRQIERLTGRTEGGFESSNAPFTQTLDGDGTQLIKVANGPITSITSIKTGNGAQTTLDASDYTFRDRTIMLIPYESGDGLVTDEWGVTRYRGGGNVFPKGHDNIEVIYTAGDAVADIDPDLKMAAYRIVDHHLDSRRSDIGKVSEAIGNTNTAYRTYADIMASVRELVAPWRDPLCE